MPKCETDFSSVRKKHLETKNLLLDVYMKKGKTHVAGCMLQWLIPRYWRIYIITDYQIIGEGWVDKLRFKAGMFAIKEYLNIPEEVTRISQGYMHEAPTVQIYYSCLQCFLILSHFRPFPQLIFPYFDNDKLTM